MLFLYKSRTNDEKKTLIIFTFSILKRRERKNFISVYSNLMPLYIIDLNQTYFDLNFK